MNEIEIEHWPKSATFYINMGNSEPYSEPNQTSETKFSFEKNKRLNAINYFHKKPHLKCLTGLWIASAITTKEGFTLTKEGFTFTLTQEFEYTWMARKLSGKVARTILKRLIFERIQSN